MEKTLRVARLQGKPDLAVEHTGLFRWYRRFVGWRKVELGNVLFGLHGGIEPPQGSICQAAISSQPVVVFSRFEVSKFDTLVASTTDLPAKSLFVSSLAVAIVIIVVTLPAKYLAHLRKVYQTQFHALMALRLALVGL